MRRQRKEPGAFESAWEADQRAWLTAARNNLRVGSRVALMIGDGDMDALPPRRGAARKRGAGDQASGKGTGHTFDNLASTTSAAEDAGFTLLASATIRPSYHGARRRIKGMRRIEHAILLEVCS